MNAKCLDIGTIQSFLDCELDQARSAEVSNHVSVCNACATLFAEAEEQSSVVFSALEREFNDLVPTQRLWTKINDSIETQRRSRRGWEKIWALVSAGFASPSFAAAAGLVIVVGGMVWFWSGRTPSPADLSDVKAPVVTSPASLPPMPKSDIRPDVSAVRASKPSAPVKPELAVYRAVKPRLVTPSPTAVAPANDRLAATDTAYMPGEDTYVKAIYSLSKIVDTQKDTAMRPSQRVAYEHDMAVVDDAIVKMKKEVKKNPANRSARQVLYASYQNKIDLLKSVSQKEELMASLR